MSTGRLEVICGREGSGKTAMALGRAMQALEEQKSVIIIQFLKGKQKEDALDVYKHLEPDMKIFRFEKSDSCFTELSEKERQEEQSNIRNGLNYAKKVLTTGECELLVLDEALGLVEQGVIKEDELTSVLGYRGEAEVIVTGRELPDGVRRIADKIKQVEVL